MAPLILKQLLILLWKSWIMRKRHWLSTIFELIFPLVLSILVVGFYSNSTKGAHSSDIKDRSTKNSISEQTSDVMKGPIYYNITKTYEINNIFTDFQTIYYAPENSTTVKIIMDYLEKSQTSNNKNFVNKTLTIVPFADEVSLEANLTTQSAISGYSSVIGVVFDLNELDNSHFKYTIRLNDQMNVDKLFPIKTDAKPIDFDGGKQYEDKFMQIQVALNEAYLNFVSNSTGRKETKVSKISPHPIPYPRYLDSGTKFGNFSFQDLISQIIILGYIAFCPLIVKRITDEKVAKAKEMLRMMGMNDFIFWLAHFINYFSVMLIHCLLFTLLYFAGWGGLPCFLYSDAFLFFCIMILFSASTILSCMLLTTIFNRPVIAVVVTVILFICSYSVVLPFLSPTYNSQMDIKATQSWRILTCLVPNLSLQWALTLIGQCENYGYGANWGNLWKTVSVYQDFTIGLVMLMMFFSCFFYGILIWYIDAIWPFQHGIPQPFYFPFLPSYWISSKKSHSNKISDDSSKQNQNYFEAEPTNTRVGITCQNLRKVFNKKTAVNDVSLNVFSGQITVLLGHNGAGKTTTMNMITGIFPPSSGTAYVDGYDIRTQTKEARRSTALCPQENILYNELDVYQHLKLYAILKGHPWNDVDNEINKTLQLVTLTDKKRSLSTQLSGGMKRKLSLGIAMIANSKILILDEPTSGMDPEARRHMWDVLQSIRRDKTILLTTHYMEEADALGDRIAIMNEGLVKCCGTPMFLKRIFGAGYHLRISKNELFNSQVVLNVVKNFMPNAQIKSEINAEIIYSLESEDSAQNSDQNSSTSLANLFDELERRSTKLGINSCGLTVTTMEDVFLRVGNECNDNEMFSKTSNGYRDPVNGSQEKIINSLNKNFGSKLRLQQFYALFLKRLHYAKRYWPMIVLQSILPAILFMSILLLDNSIKKSIGVYNSPLELNLKMYGNTEGFIRSDVPGIPNIYTEFAANQRMKTENISKYPNYWYIESPKANDLNAYIKTYLVGGEVNKTEDRNDLYLIPWFNNEAYHSLPPSINFLYETLLRILFPSKDVSITVTNHPIPQNNSYGIYVVRVGLIIICFLMVPITVPFIGASYVLFPIHERISNSKLLQLMNGISPIVFWGASFVFDMLNHLIACIFIFIVFAIFDWNHVFLGQAATSTGLFFMLFLFGFASIPLAYIASLLLKKPSSGFAILVIIYLISGIVLIFPLGFCDLLINTFKEDFMSSSTLDILIFICRLLPVFSMSFGIQKLYKIGSYRSACKKILPIFLKARCEQNLQRTDEIWGCCENVCKKTKECYKDAEALNWGTEGVAIEFTFLIISGFVYLIILWLIEGNFERILYFFDSLTKTKKEIPTPNEFGRNSLIYDVLTGQWSQRANHEDYDVMSERQRIDGLSSRRSLHEDAIVVKDLTKRFGKLIPIKAVNRLTFGVHKEECFGLLGVNGAGKTTTFKMLTGEETVSDGNAFIDFLDLRHSLKSFQQRIGYCPQFDALLDKITGRETIHLFARLRGMPEELIPSYTNDLVKMVDLGKHVDKCTEAYSGGNRRKLSLAIALCATPPVIFLDEPTSGVDPSARRKIWSTLVNIQEKYRSAIILTSHSMEECEALCSRIAIMVNGEFKCLGSVQHLRSKFGQGFTVMAKLKRELVEQSAYMADIQTYFKQQLPSAVLKDIHQCLLHYHIADTSVLWSHMFRVMEDIKSKFYLEDYIISDTTLEQIFIAFARSQR